MEESNKLFVKQAVQLGKAELWRGDDGKMPTKGGPLRGKVPAHEEQQLCRDNTEITPWQISKEQKGAKMWLDE